MLHNPNNKKLIKNRMGREYWIWDTDKLYEQRLARENGPYQARNLVMCRKCKPNARTIIDVGANIGTNTIEYATWAKHIKSFEPMLSSFSLMELNIDIARAAKLKGKYYNNKAKAYIHAPEKDDGWFKFSNKTFASLDIIGDIKLFNCALGNKTDKIIMEEKTGECSRGDAVLQENKETKNPTQPIHMYTLDSFDFEDVDIIKVDVEGYELSVLEGAVNTIKKHNPIVQIELRDTHCKRFGYHPNDIISLVMGLGNYVMCDFNGRDLGEHWIKVPGVMDRFFVPQHIYQTLDIKMKVHPGMKKNVNGSLDKILDIA